MSQSILVNDVYPDISFTKNNTWQTVDLDGLLNHDDPKGVIIHVHNTAGTARMAGAKPAGSAITNARILHDVHGFGTYQVPVSLNGGTTVQLRSEFATGLDFSIMAEFGGDDVEMFADYEAVPGSANAWVTKDYTVRYGADAGNVAASILMHTWEINRPIGTREFGSTEDLRPGNANEGNTFVIVGVDDQDRFQTWNFRTGGKSPSFVSFHYQCGYIKSNTYSWNGIQNPVDRNLNVLNTVTEEDITDVTSADARVALIRLNNVFSLDDGWVRNKGGSLTIFGWSNVTARHAFVNIDASQIYEYYIEDADINQYILGWLDVEPVSTQKRQLRSMMQNTLKPMSGMDNTLA